MRGHNTPGDRSNNGAGSRGLDNSGATTGESGSRTGRRFRDRWHLLRWLTKFALKKTMISSQNRSAMSPRNHKDTDQSSHDIDNAFQTDRGEVRMSHSVCTLRRACIPLFTVLAGSLLSGCGVNNIPTYDESAKAKWSDVQNQFQRRADLIPNLVETVKGYATQEREVLTQVTEARAKASQIKVDAATVTDPAK